MSANGMFRTILATQLGEAFDKDARLELSDGLAAQGVSGPNVSRVILDIAEALAPTGERFFCNKCGYHGKDQRHLRDNTLTPCNYMASPGMDTFVLYAWHVQFVSPGKGLYVYSQDDLQPWANNKNVTKITPLYALRK